MKEVVHGKERSSLGMILLKGDGGEDDLSGKEGGEDSVTSLSSERRKGETLL